MIVRQEAAVWRWGRRAGFSPTWMLVILMTITLATGCGDSRISVDEMMQREAELAPSMAEAEIAELKPAEFALTELQPYHVGPGDVLVATFTGLEGPYSQTTLQLRVHEDGTVMLPLVGRLEVSGLDLKGVEEKLYEAHVPNYVKSMSVYVDIGGPETTTVMVVGAASQTGLVRLKRNERNVIYALSRAVAFSDMGSGRVVVKPADPSRPELSYDLTDVNDLRRALVGPRLNSGDMIVVEPAAPSVIYVTGLVNAPGPISVPKDGKLMLSRVVAAAGGLRDFLEPEEATIWRQMPDGDQVRAKVPLLDVMSGKVADIALKPGDLLDVPHTPKTRALEWVAANVRLGPFGVTAMYDPVADRRARILQEDDGVARRLFLQNVSTGLAELLVPTAP